MALECVLTSMEGIREPSSDVMHQHCKHGALIYLTHWRLQRCSLSGELDSVVAFSHNPSLQITTNNLVIPDHTYAQIQNLP